MALLYGGAICLQKKRYRLHHKRNKMMIKVNSLSKAVFIIIPIILTLFFVYKTYHNQSTTSRPTNYTELSDAGLHGERNRDKITELSSLLSEIKTSLDNLNEEIFQNKMASEERMKKIESSIDEIAEEGVINSNAIAEEPLLTPLEEQQYRQEQAFDQMSTFNDALAGEERDESWATGMEETMLLASQNEVYNGSTFYSPTCKSTFCKLEVYHLDEDSRDSFENIRREIPNSYHIQHFEEAGELRSVLYIIKRGEESRNIIFNTLNESS